jgi:hypothetical protein
MGLARTVSLNDAGGRLPLSLHWTPGDFDRNGTPIESTIRIEVRHEAGSRARPWRELAGLALRSGSRPWRVTVYSPGSGSKSFPPSFR